MLTPCTWLHSGYQKLLGGLLIFLCSQYVHAAALTINVVLGEQNEIYQRIFSSLQNSLSSENVKLSISLAGDPVSEADLVVAVGTKSANSLVASPNTAVIYLLLPKSRYASLAKRNHQSAIYVEQPPERPLHLLEAALPQKKRIGILFSPPASDALVALRRHLPEHRMSVYHREINATQSMAEALQDVLTHSDVLLALPDSNIYNSNTLRNILFSTYRAGVPLIGFSAGYVNAGALAAVHTTPAQYAEQAAIMIKQYARSGTLPTAQYPHDFEVSVNKQVARSLGLVLKDERDLAKVIIQLERGNP